MVKFTFDQGAYIIENKFLYAFTQAQNKYINFATDIWADMNYSKSDFDIIDYPWEYDIKGIRIICLLWKDQKLNYLVFQKTKNFWIIQSPDILESDDVQDMEYRLYTNDSVEKKIDQLELEWQKIKLQEHPWEINTQITIDDTDTQTQTTQN